MRPKKRNLNPARAVVGGITHGTQAVVGGVTHGAQAVKGGYTHGAHAVKGGYTRGKNLRSLFFLSRASKQDKKWSVSASKQVLLFLFQAGNEVTAAGVKLNNVAVVKYGTGFFADYRKFMDRGNVVDLAVAVVVGKSVCMSARFRFLDERGLKVQKEPLRRTKKIIQEHVFDLIHLCSQSFLCATPQS